MTVMDIGHVSVFVLGTWMLMFVGMNHVSVIMCVELLMFVDMFMHHRHMDVKMGVFFVRQHQCASDHQHCGDAKQYCDRVFENQNGKQHTCQRSCPIQGAGARRAES